MAPLVRTGGSRHTGLAALPHRNIHFAMWDDYETDYTIFSVCGIDIRVLDDELAEALKKLPERKRNTLLMYYFLEMTESEIANLQKITQSGVFRNRHHALETMKKILKEKQ